uniref:Uncharacterized protein n=1 Tax=Rhizophora mucronata TaxID=61149 RepID=A0A2P2R2N4_RHIMU
MIKRGINLPIWTMCSVDIIKYPQIAFSFRNCILKPYQQKCTKRKECQC